MTLPLDGALSRGFCEVGIWLVLFNLKTDFETGRQDGKDSHECLMGCWTPNKALDADEGVNNLFSVLSVSSVVNSGELGFDAQKCERGQALIIDI
jgi:hypothetical protein